MTTLATAPDPLRARKAWLPQVERKGLALAPVSAVVRRNMTEEGEAQR